MKKVIKVGNIAVGGNEDPKILGVLNISPESFYSDSFVESSKSYLRAEEIRKEGADIIDVGARSTALNSPQISVTEERDRVITALKELEGYPIPLSLDTCHVEVLNAALHYDISLINDISGLSNKDYAKVVADSGLPVIAMAANKVPGDPTNIISTHQALKIILERAEKNGIENLILDPGIGKWVEERSADADWELCQRFKELEQYGLPLLAAVSRKLFIGETIQKPPENRLFGSLAVLYHLMENGADLLRVHDIAPTRDFITIYSRLNQKRRL